MTAAPGFALKELQFPLHPRKGASCKQVNRDYSVPAFSRKKDRWNRALPGNSLNMGDHPSMASTPTPPPIPPATCGNCGAPLYGKYCHACGQPAEGLVRHLLQPADRIRHGVYAAAQPRQRVSPTGFAVMPGSAVDRLDQARTASGMVTEMAPARWTPFPGLCRNRRQRRLFARMRPAPALLVLPTGATSATTGKWSDG